MGSMGHNGNIKTQVMFPKSTMGVANGIYDPAIDTITSV